MFLATAALFLFFTPSLDASQSPISRSNTIVLSEPVYKGKPLGPYFEYLMDHNGDATIDDVISGKYHDQFTKPKTNSLGFGFNTHPIWLRCRIENPGQTVKDFFLEIGYSHLDQIALYIPDNTGSYQVRRAGDNRPFHDREFYYHNFIFRLSQKPGIATYYIRIQTTSSLSLPLSIYDQKHLEKKLITEYLLYGLVYGIILVMILYNLFVYVSTRDFAYLAYIGFLIPMLMLTLSLNGFGYMFLWSGSPLIQSLAPFFLPLADTGAFFFSMVYLNTRKNAPVFHKICLGMLVVYLLMMICANILPYNISVRLASGLQGIGIAILMTIGFVYLKRKKRAAYFFFPSWFFLLAGAATAQLRVAGIFPSNSITLMSAELGVVVQVILFSLGLADKLNYLKNRLLDMNLNLENKVNQRTEALRKTNTQLMEMRDALWGEMMLAKKIQTVLLPAQPKADGYEVLGYMQTADEVGGDYYDVINVAGHDWFVIGDVSGHGVSAGLVMMMVQTAIHVALKENPEVPPSRILESVNSIITENVRRLGEDKYMTIAVFAVHKNGKFEFSGLHQDILIYRADTTTVHELQTTGIWLGVVENIEGMLRDDNALLLKDDVMLLYTDGITEATDESGKMYSEQRLKQVFEQAAVGSTKEIKDAIIASLEGYSRTDDTTMLIVKKT